MSEMYEHDHITHRLVTALDSLPVPQEPTGFSATAKPSLARDPRLLLAAALLLVLVATVTSPQFQRAAAELSRYIERIVSGPRWVGYYFESAGQSASGRPTFRLMVASSDSQPAPATPDVSGEFSNHGGWSPEGDRITVSSGGQLYVGDRSGRLRPIANLGPDDVVLQSGWISKDKVWALAVGASLPSFVTVELTTGTVERRVLDNGDPAQRFSGSVVSTMSPDGRWLPVYEVGYTPGGPLGACGVTTTALYDLVRLQTVEVVDASSQRAALAFGFLSDGRIVVGQCDRAAGTLELYVGAPGERPSRIAVVPTTVRAPVVTIGSGRDEILVIAAGPETAQSAYVFDPAGRLLRRTPIPQLATPGSTIAFAQLSRDGNSIGFVVNELRSAPLVDFVFRAGVVDLATGQVTYLCDSGCDWLLLR